MQKYIRTEQGVFDIEKEVKKVLDSVIEEVNFSYQLNLESARNENEYRDLKEKLKKEIDSIKVKVDFNEYFYVYVEASFTDRDNDFGKIIKSSDFIEELCDGFYLELDTIPMNERFFNYDRASEEFVGVDKTKCVFVVYKTSPVFQKMKGFIKTDKGLIYVAKMNEKGELELL